MCLSVSVYERQCTDDPPEKIWYFFGFTALGASVYGAAFLTGLTGNLWIGVQIQLTGVLLLGILLFHRKIGSLLLDLFVNILLILSIEVGIFLGNYLLAQGAFENLVWYGNVTMLFKMFFMIPVTSAAVMWRKRQQETEMGNLQILLLLLLPLFSVLFLYSLIEMGRIYMDLYGVRLMVVNLAALVLLNFCFCTCLDIGSVPISWRGSLQSFRCRMSCSTDIMRNWSKNTESPERSYMI